MQDIFLNRGANPPHRVGRKTEPTLRIKPFHRLHQTDIPFRNHFIQRQAVATVAHRNFSNKTQVTRDHLVGRMHVVMLIKTF